MANKRKRTLLHLRRADVVHALRTTIAAGIALEIAGLFELPEAYWAAMTTLIAMQSTLGAALTISEHRFAGTALGAGMGALIATYFAPNVVWLAVDVFFLGIICSMVGLDKAAYRFAGVTLAIVMLVSRTKPAWVNAVHRFAEVSVGIGVGLILPHYGRVRKRRRVVAGEFFALDAE
jgi:uncharacterized membrane protein YgaE (UPF0421/DUF939 family)